MRAGLVAVDVPFAAVAPTTVARMSVNDSTVRTGHSSPNALPIGVWQRSAWPGLCQGDSGCDREEQSGGVVELECEELMEKCKRRKQKMKCSAVAEWK